MNDVLRFPKGHRVIVALDLDWAREICKQKHATWTEDDDKGFVECFVAGDTPEKGLSLVSLDNPEWCLMSINYEDSTSKEWRICIAQGYAPFMSHTFNTAYGRPICRY